MATYGNDVTIHKDGTVRVQDFHGTALDWFAERVPPGVPRMNWPRFFGDVVAAILHATISLPDVATFNLAKTISTRLHQVDWEILQAAHKAKDPASRELALSIAMRDIPTYRITAYLRGKLSAPALSEE
jgi:hypothetical protein